jgi:UDP-N-acetyl-D-mannosaminuronic acid dehydrogenase
VGGHCIAVDPWFIVAAAPEEARLIRAAREVNDAKPGWVIDRVRQRAARLRDPVIGCLGLSFKANVDDLRESPALAITRALIAAGIGRVLACEPHVERFDEFPLHDLPTVLREADILVLLVDHEQFRTVDRALLQEKVVIDTRGLWR